MKPDSEETYKINGTDRAYACSRTHEDIQEMKKIILEQQIGMASLNQSLTYLAKEIGSLSTVLEQIDKMNERVFGHLQKTIPLKFVILLFLMAVASFGVGGVLQEIKTEHLLGEMIGSK